MKKKAYGFRSKEDFKRTELAVRKIEKLPMTGSRRGRKYPLGGGGGVKIERAILTSIGNSGVHTAFLITGGFEKDLDDPQVVSSLGTTPVYAGDHITFQLEAGDEVYLGKIGTDWWIIEAPQDCHGGCIDEPHPVTYPGYVAQYMWNMPAMACCPEASGVHILPAVSLSEDTTWESATFQCNADGTDRKWVYDGEQLQLEPPLPSGTVKYKHVGGNSICPTKMYAFEYPSIFPEGCGDFPKTACIIPMCVRKVATSCDGFANRNWVMAFSGGSLSNVNPSAHCGFLIPGTRLTNQFTGDDSTTDAQYKPDSRHADPATWFYINMVLAASPSFPSSNSIGLNNGDATYRIRDDAEPNCTGLNIFDLYSLDETPLCSGYPETIYVYPADGEFFSSKCYPSSGLPMWLNSPTGSVAQLSDWHCRDAPYVYTVEFTTVANDSCSDCETFNQKFEMFLELSNYFKASYKTFFNVGVDEAACGGGEPLRIHARLVIYNSDTCFLRLATTASEFPGGSETIWAYYEFDGGSMSNWNCNGVNDFTLVSESAYCDFPATVQVRRGGI